MGNTILFTEKLGRVFVSPAFGCASKCRFCYTEARGFTTLALSPFQGNDVKDKLLKSPHFFPGRYGTLISLSPDTEAFDKRVLPKTLDFIASLSPLGNPMQIATRRKIERDVIKRIVDSLAYPNQLTLFVSNSTITYHSIFEPGTTLPAKRFETFGICSDERLPACLYIKPVIPSITIQDCSVYATIIEQYDIQYCCVGVLYTNDALMGNINHTLEMLRQPPIKQTLSNSTLPFSEEMVLVENTEEIRLLEAALKKTASTIHRTSSCVVAQILKIPSPQATWIQFPLLCIQCQQCAELAHSFPPPVLRIGRKA